MRERLADVVRRFSWYHANAFGAAVDIAWCWLALGRVSQARALADQLADGISAEAIHNLWAPAADVICLAARLARQANDSARHGQLIVRIATTREYVTPAERHYLEEHLDDARAALEPHRVPGPIEAVCDDITASLSRAVYFAETLRAGRFRWQQWLSLDPVEAILSEGLQLLGDHLAGRITLPQRLDVAPIPEHTGILLVDARAIPEDVNALWWIDLATGTSGRVEHGKYSGECFPIRGSSAVWLLQVSTDEADGATLVERTASGVTSTFVADFDVRGISPDGRHAVVNSPRDGLPVAAMIDGTTLTRGESFGMTADYYRVTLCGVLADGSIVTRTFVNEHEVLVERFPIGTRPTTLVDLESATEVLVADDGSVIVAIRELGDDDDDDGGARDVELSIYHSASGEPPRTLLLGRGNLVHARLAPGDRHVVVSLTEEERGDRVLAVDLATGSMVVLASGATSAFTVSPDGRFVMIWNETLVIVPIEGGTPRTTTINGYPRAWLR